MAEQPNMSAWQQKWLATGRANFEQRTGKSLEAWVAIAKTCPATGHRAQLKWFKDNYGLLQNSASMVINEAFGRSMGWSDPDALREALWTDPKSRAIYEAVEKAVLALPEVVAVQRKGYSSWSRKYQFASVKPIRGGTARLGLAVPPDASPRLEPYRNEGWSERLKAAVNLASPADLDAELTALLKRAWEGS